MDKLSSSITFWSRQPIENHIRWLEEKMRTDDITVLNKFFHLKYIYENGLSATKNEYVYIEYLFKTALELKFVQYAQQLLNQLKNNFDPNQLKIIRLENNLNDIIHYHSADENAQERTLMVYKKLIQSNQEDRQSLKDYILVLKASMNIHEYKQYVDVWNEYLKVYQDDYEAWYELSDIYLLTNNYNKAIYCLEECILHSPNSFELYNKIGDIYCTLNNTECAASALKYYSQSILIKPNLRAFWGIVYACSLFPIYNKTLTEKQAKLLKIAKAEIGEFYKNTPFDSKITKLMN